MTENEISKVIVRSNPNGVVSSSPGLPLRLPWETMNANVSNPKGVVSTFVGWNAIVNWHNPVGVEIGHFKPAPRVAEAATLGWRTEPLCGSRLFHAKRQRWSATVKSWMETALRRIHNLRRIP